MQAYHDSRDPEYRMPGGAQPCGRTVRLFLRTDAAQADLRLWIDGNETVLPMERKEGGFGIGLTLPDKPCIVWYHFRLPDGLFYGNNRDDLGGEGALARTEPPSFQITVYDPAFRTPSWAGDGVMMQILPDRFFRAGNGPVRGHMHRDRNELPAMRLTENGDNAADDFYGGDLKGIAEKLPYLKELGITILYLNPIFLSPSNHKYDTSDYLTIDPAFGTEQDLKDLCAKAKEAGIRILLDGVFSHTGSDSIYFDRKGRFGSRGAARDPESPYRDWYRFRRWPDRYDCWWGFDTLPTINKDSPSFRRFLLGPDGVCAHWMRTGISGWRLDVADELPMDLIASFRRRMKRERPGGLLIGEVWEDPSRKVAYGKLRSYCLGDTLDGVMNYPLRDALISFITGKEDAALCAGRLGSLYENLPPLFAGSCMNLLGSHDKPRALSILADAGNMEPERKYRRPVTLTKEQYALGRSRLIALWRTVCVLPGIPCIYYGDEAGMTGMADPYCRAAYPWGREDRDLQASFREAILLRRGARILTRGSVSVRAEDPDRILISRTLNGKTLRFRLDRTGGGTLTQV